MNLTELETKTLTTFIGGLYAEPGFSDVDVNDLSSELGISTKVLRGALGSLVKKNIVFVAKDIVQHSLDGLKNYDFTVILLRNFYNHNLIMGQTQPHFCSLQAVFTQYKL